MPAHGHGGGDEEEIITPNVDGPPFADVKAKQGQGFTLDFDRVQKHLGPGKISLADFKRDMDMINKLYLPIAHKNYRYLQAGNIGMMGALVILILMGIIGGTPESRGVVMPLAMVIFLVGLLSFLYSKYLEQGSIREAADAVRKVVEEVVNPRYEDSPHRIKWVVCVHLKPKKSYHMGRQIMERPVISIYCLRSPNAEGVLTDWELPEALTHGVYVQDGGDLKVTAGAH